MQIELHRHLDISIRLTTLHELGQNKGLIPQSTPVEAFGAEFLLRTPQKDLRTVIEEFSFFQKILDRPEVLERVAYEAVEDCRTEGSTGVEFRFSPGFVSEFSKLSYDLILDSFETGVRRAVKAYPEMQVGFICIITREFGLDAADETVDFFLRNKGRMIAMDLAGNEDLYPCRQFVEPFKKLQGSAVTIHAGEASGPENIWEAIELLGAQRVGHGIRSIEDPKLLDVLRDKKICLEICPTSNIITCAAPAYDQHPLKRFLEHGVPCSLNTDDPGIFGVTLPHEFEVARRKMGLSDEDIAQCRRSAQLYTFLK